jgi:hypothetical protein
MYTSPKTMIEASAALGLMFTSLKDRELLTIYKWLLEPHEVNDYVLLNALVLGSYNYDKHVDPHVSDQVESVRGLPLHVLYESALMGDYSKSGR